jgi:uncharacterized protein (DUF885 family)
MRTRLSRLPLLLAFGGAAACGPATPAKSAGPAATAAAHAPAPAEAPASDPAADLAKRRVDLEALLDEVWEWHLATSPEDASTLGDRRYNDRWDDRSPAGIAARLEERRAFVGRLEALDLTGLSEQERLSRDLQVRNLREDLDQARFEPWLMPIDQMHGPHLDLPVLVSMLPFATVKDYEDYLRRLETVPTVFEQVQGLMRLGLERKLMPPRYVLEVATRQVEGLASDKPDKSPFAAPVGKFPAAIPGADQVRLRAAILAAIRDRVLPAYRALATFMRTDYAPHGRSEVGVWSLPDGDARYVAALAEQTTTDLGPEAIHEIGLREVARIEAEQEAIGKRLGFRDLAAFRAHVRGDRKLYARSRADILERYRRYTDQMKAKLPALFGRLPLQQLVIEQVEAFREKEASGAAYFHGTQDGSRPGMVRVNTYEPRKRLTIDIESTAYHEGVPGHHMQIAIQQELQGLPRFRQHIHFGAYIEGWALYSERLGKEVGFYEDPYNDYGRLQDEMLRAIRLVVDTGLHAKHWSRQQVVDYFHAHSTIDEPTVQSETDRYIVWPGQACAYKLGQLTILDLRSRAQEALGDRFDLRGFHDEVLGAGPLPLDMLQARMSAWIEGQRGAAAK